MVTPSSAIHNFAVPLAIRAGCVEVPPVKSGLEDTEDDTRSQKSDVAM
jgi:hypothetical protein